MSQMPPQDAVGEQSRYQWLFDDTPELQYFDDDDDRAAAMQRMRRRQLGLGFWLYATGLAVSAGLVVGPGLSLAGRWMPFVPDWGLGMAAVISYVILFYLGFGVLWQGAIRRDLRMQLVERGIPLCLACGYDCRGLPICPECGTSRDKEHLP